MRAETDFLAFQKRLDNELLNHPIITDNTYAQWFRKGAFSKKQLKEFIVQFSVFSNWFLVAQLHKMINADSLRGMRASKEILCNELGVVFKSSHGGTKLDSLDPKLGDTEGSIDGGMFHFSAAHFEWLLRVAEHLDLSFCDVGKRRHGTPTTLFFCDELTRLYGSEDYAVSQAASYAIENWAAAGFWKDLIAGLTAYNKRTASNLPLAFFVWHDKIEDQHARHTEEELAEYYSSHTVDEDAFISYGNQMLDGVSTFWNWLPC